MDLFMDVDLVAGSRRHGAQPNRDSSSSSSAAQSSGMPGAGAGANAVAGVGVGVGVRLMSSSGPRVYPLCMLAARYYLRPIVATTIYTPTAY
jgi:hypothetical protein